MGTRYLVDDNGVVIREINDSEFCQVKSQKKTSHWSKGKEIKMNFSKANAELVGICCSKYSLFPYLIGHINYFDNALTYDNGRVMKTENIARLCPLSIKTIRKQIKDMKDDEILAKINIEGRNYICVNPWIIHKGIKTNETVYDMFFGSKWSSEKDGKNI